MVLIPFLLVLTFNSKSSLSPFPFWFFVFGKCCCTHLKWSDIAGSWLGEWSYFCFVSSLGWSRVGTFRHTCFRQPLPLLLPGSWTFCFRLSQRKCDQLVRAGQNSPLEETVVSLNWLQLKKDGMAPKGWWLWLESQRLLFSWHGRFCQMNFFVSNIDVWKWRNWWWLSQNVWDTVIFAHFWIL